MFATAGNRVAAVRAVAIRNGTVVFERLESLRGDTPESLSVRMRSGDLERVRVGTTYVLGYTLTRRDPRGRSREPQVDPLGPRVIEIPVVGAALLEDSEWIRSIATAVSGGGDADSRELIDSIVGQIARPDVASRRLVMAELALRPELAGLLEEADLEILRLAFESGELEPLAIDYLLRGLGPVDDELDWLAAGCRTLIENQAVQLDLGSAVPAMLRSAITTLGARGAAPDARLLARHLESNNPAIGRAALEVMAALDPDFARAAATSALEVRLHRDVRRAVLIYLGSEPGREDGST